MKYLFILGRNIELSVAELKAFFRKNDLKFEQLGLMGNGLLVESSAKLEKGTIAKLGGVVSIGEVLASGDAEEIFSQLDKIELYRGKGNKMNYVIHDFSGRDSQAFGEIESYLKQRFKKEKIKATEKKLTGNIKLQGGESVGKVSSKLIGEEFFVFSSRGENYFGRILESSDYNKIEKRDMGKPVRRNELAISPRLAKILINLSELKKGETLLDPFCGIGVVLQEALLQKIKVVGVDVDKSAIAGARENLKFFGFEQKDYKLIKGDSSEIRLNEKISGIATEPDLGELQKKVPSENEAKKIVEGFEKLMTGVLKNLKGDLRDRGKVAFTAPLIFTGNKKKRVGCDFEKIAGAAGLKILENISEFRKGQVVGRSVVVLGK